MSATAETRAAVFVSISDGVAEIVRVGFERWERNCGRRWARYEFEELGALDFETLSRHMDWYRSFGYSDTWFEGYRAEWQRILDFEEQGG